MKKEVKLYTFNIFQGNQLKDSRGAISMEVPISVIMKGFSLPEGWTIEYDVVKDITTHMSWLIDNNYGQEVTTWQAKIRISTFETDLVVGNISKFKRFLK